MTRTRAVWALASLPIHGAHLPWAGRAHENAPRWSNCTSQTLFRARKNRWPVNNAEDIWSWSCGQRMINVTLLKDGEIFNWLDGMCTSGWRPISLIPTEKWRSQWWTAASSVPVLISGLHSDTRQGHAKGKVPGEPRMWCTAARSELQIWGWILLLPTNN